MRESRPIFYVVSEGPRASPSELARLARALKPCGARAPWRRRDGDIQEAVRAALRRGCRAAVVASGASSVADIERIAGAAPRLPVALVRFGPGLDEWHPRHFPGPGTPETIWDLPARASQTELSRLVRESFVRLLSPAPAPAARGLSSVIIPCWNGLAETKQCLSSLRRWTEDFEAIVVDNGSTDGTGAYLRSLREPRLRVVSNRANLGFPRAINQGLERARGRWVVWLNNDAVVTPGWLERLIDCARRHPRPGAVGPYTNRINGVQKVEGALYTLETLPAFATAWSLSHAGRARAVHRLTGFCLLHPREAVADVGGLDERFGMGCYEDLDFCLRLRQAGRELLLAEDVFIHHHGHRSFERNEVPGEHVARNRTIFVDKWCHKALSFLDELDRELERR